MSKVFWRLIIQEQYFFNYSQYATLVRGQESISEANVARFDIMRLVGLTWEKTFSNKFKMIIVLNIVDKPTLTCHETYLMKFIANSGTGITLNKNYDFVILFHQSLQLCEVTQQVTQMSRTQTCQLFNFSYMFLSSWRLSGIPFCQHKRC
jgi:hypothetical protein